MTPHILLRIDAPLISFGAPQVDAIGRTERFIGRSMVAGLLANALGYDHSEHTKTQRLQDRLQLACRCDRPGMPLMDYQTVDLGQTFLLDKYAAWTTWGRRDDRRGGSASKGTHIRERHYLADALYTVAVGLVPGQRVEPSIQSLVRAINHPRRPLFIGRKPCIPSAPLYLSSIEAVSPLDALLRSPRIDVSRQRGEPDEGLAAWWDEHDAADQPAQYREVPVTDQRDWQNQLHCGQRLLRHGLVFPPPKEGQHVG